MGEMGKTPAHRKISVESIILFVHMLPSGSKNIDLLIYECLAMGQRVHKINLKGCGILNCLELLEIYVTSKLHPFLRDLINEVCMVFVT
jgi:hypothetical protein